MDITSARHAGSHSSRWKPARFEGILLGFMAEWNRTFEGRLCGQMSVLLTRQEALLNGWFIQRGNTTIQHAVSQFSSQIQRPFLFGGPLNIIGSLCWCFWKDMGRGGDHDGELQDTGPRSCNRGPTTYPQRRKSLLRNRRRQRQNNKRTPPLPNNQQKRPLQPPNPPRWSSPRPPHHSSPKRLSYTQRSKVGSQKASSGPALQTRNQRGWGHETSSPKPVNRNQRGLGRETFSMTTSRLSFYQGKRKRKWRRF